MIKFLSRLSLGDLLLVAATVVTVLVIGAVVATVFGAVVFAAMVNTPLSGLEIRPCG